MPTQSSPPKPRDLLPEAPEGTHWVTAFGEIGDNEYFYIVHFSGMHFKYKLVKELPPEMKMCYTGPLSMGGHGVYSSEFCPRC